jgi:hypothetical protein
MLIAQTTAWSWILWFSNRRRAQVVVGSLLWLTLAVSYFDDWSFDGYRRMADRRQRGFSCIEEYYANGGSGLCKSVFPMAMAPYLDTAQDFDLDFVVRIREGSY